MLRGEKTSGIKYGKGLLIFYEAFGVLHWNCNLMLGHY